MKNLIRTIVAIIFIASAACRSNSDQVIAGIYATAFENEYAKANDTMIISTYNLEAHTYQIERRSGFNKIREGKIMPREYKREKWMAVYDSKSQILEVSALGRKIYFKPDAHELMMGSTAYRQIDKH